MTTLEPSPATREAGAESVEFSLEVPEKTQSFTLVAEAPSRKITAEGMEGPGGPLKLPPRWDVGVLAVTYPALPDQEVRPGAYRLRLSFSGPSGTVQLKALRKPSPPPRTRQVLDLHLFLVGIGLTAREAGKDPNLQRALEEVRRILGEQGVELGQLRYQEVTGGEGARLAVVESENRVDDEFAELLALSSRQEGPGLAVFLVKEIYSRDQAGSRFIALGLAPSTGAPPGPGTRTSGVAVAALNLQDSPVSVGSVMAHEVGHWLGLEHTTERNGKTFDPLPDTPECPLSEDQNLNGTLDSEECVGLGSDNVMFWVARPDQVEHLTAGQGFVLRQHPTVETRR